MLKKDLQAYLNSYIQKEALKLDYIVKAEAPGTEKDLFNSTSLIIWEGASENTIYGDASINHAFRAIHDAMHLKTGLDFSPEQEIEMGRIQAAKCSSDIIAKLFYIEIAGQAEYYLKNRCFVEDQISFTLNALQEAK